MTGQAVIGALRADLILNTAQFGTSANEAMRTFNRLKGSMDGLSGAADKSGRAFNGSLKSGVGSAKASFSAINSELEKLRSRFDPLSVATQKYEQELRDLKTAQVALGLSSDHVAAQQKRLAASFEFNKQAINGFGASAQQAGFHSTNLFFQLQDISTMMASGQSPFVLAMQQGPQVVGIFEQIKSGGGSMGASLLGAFRSLVSPMSLLTVGAIAGGAALFYWATGADDAGKEADKAKDPVDALNAAFDRHKASAETATTAISELRKKYGEYASFIREAAAEQSVRDMYAAFDAVKPVLGTIGESTDGIRKLSNQISEIRENIDRTKAAAAANGNVFVDVNTILAGESSIRKLTARMNELAVGAGMTADQILNFTSLMSNIDAAVESNNIDQMAESAKTALEFLNSIPESADFVASAFGISADKLLEMVKRASEAKTLTGQVEAAANGVGSQLARAASNAAALRNNLGGARAALAGIGAEVSEINRDIAVELKALNAGVDIQVARKRAEVQRAFDAVRNSPVGDATQAAREFEKANAEIDKMEQGLAAVKAKQDALNDKGSSGGGGSSKLSDAQKALEKTADEVKKLNEAFEAGETPIAKFRAELKKLDDLKLKGLSDGAYAAGVAKLTQELGKASILGKLLGGGGLGSIWDDFKTQGKDAWSGLLTEAFSKGGGGFKAISSGLSTAFKSVGSMFTGGGMMAGLSGAMPILGAVIAGIDLVKGLMGSTTDTDTGFKGQITLGGQSLQKYTDKHWSGFWGMANNRWTEIEEAPSNIALPLSRASSKIQSEVMKMADRLGFGADSFKNFTYKIDVSLKGLSEDQALEKLKSTLSGMGDAFSSIVPGIESMQELSSVFNERMGIDRQILQLKGDEAALRQMDLDATHDLNDARLMELHALQDAKKASDEMAASLAKLSPEMFATALDFARAQNRAVVGLRVVGGTAAAPAQIASGAGASTAAQATMDTHMYLARILSVLQSVQRDDALAVVNA